MYVCINTGHDVYSVYTHHAFVWQNNSSVILPPLSTLLHTAEKLKKRKYPQINKKAFMTDLKVTSSCSSTNVRVNLHRN